MFITTHGQHMGFDLKPDVHMHIFTQKCGESIPILWMMAGLHRNTAQVVKADQPHHLLTNKSSVQCALIRNSLKIQTHRQVCK